MGFIRDAGGQPEISSKILTTKDFKLVYALLQKLSHEKTSDGTSAHIHIGLPEKFDEFSLLAMFSLVDEYYIKNRLPNRQYDTYTKFSSATIQRIKNILLKPMLTRQGLTVMKHIHTGKEKFISSQEADAANTEWFQFHFTDNKIDDAHKEQFEDFKRRVKNNELEIMNEDETPLRNQKVVRFLVKHLNPENHTHEVKQLKVYDKAGDNKSLVINKTTLATIVNDIKFKLSGINLMNYEKNKVIEFRYLSSQILKKPQEFFEFINYFLFIPYIAKRAKRFKLDNLEFKKLPNGNTEITLLSNK